MNLADWVQIICCPLTIVGVLALLYAQGKERREWRGRMLALERQHNSRGPSLPVYTYDTETTAGPCCHSQSDPDQPGPMSS